MAVALMYLGVWSWSRQTPELQTECHNGKNVSNFEQIDLLIHVHPFFS